jgi:prepilin-type N-terminal cleavage/methylation domain-containing protein
MTRKNAGFSIIELVVTMAILMIVSAIAIPQSVTMLRSYRLSSSARSLAHQISFARLRAASDFTQAQIVINPAASSYTMQMCTANQAAGCPNAADFANDTTTGVQFLPSGMAFGFGPATVQPAGTQPAMLQTAQVRFNSRGIPIVLDGTGAVNPNDVIYLTDNQGHAYAVSVTAGGHPRVWMFSAGGWTRQ